MASGTGVAYNLNVSVMRNDPCPCGSGLKYKRCCLGKTPPLRGKRLLWSALVVVLAVGAAVVMSVLHGLTTGLGTGVVLLMIAGILHIVRRPPPPGHSRGGPSGLNFGR